MASESTYVVPSIGTKGRFTFSPPFDNEKYNGKEYQVAAIRELKELQDSGEKPFESIYKIMGITQTEFEKDINNNVPILVLTDLAGKYLYVPADLVKGMPDITGIKYQELILASSLGLVPYNDISTDKFDALKNDIKETILERYGVNTTVEELRGSAIRFIEQKDHEKYKRILDKNKKEKFSYKTRYNQLTKTYNNLVEQYKELEKFVIEKIANNPDLKKALSKD